MSILIMLRTVSIPLVCAFLVSANISRAQSNADHVESAGSVDRRTLQETVQEATSLLDRVETTAPIQRSAADMEEIEGLIRAVKAEQPANPLLPLLWGRLYALQQKGGESSDVLLEFVKTREGRDNWRAFRTLGNLFVESYPQLARHHYKTADSLNPGEPSILFGLSASAVKLGQLKEATKHGQAACTADGYKTAQYVAHLARLFRVAQRWDEALVEAIRALKLAQSEVQAAPGQREPLMMLDLLYLDLIGHLQAKVDTTAKPAPSDYLALARYLRERVSVAGQLVDHEALAVLTRAMQQTERKPPPALLEQHAILLAKVGKTPEAIAAFTRLLKLDPDNATAIEWLAQLRP